MEKQSLLYFTPSNTSASDAGAVRAYHNIKSLKDYFDITLVYGVNNNEFFFNLPSNKDSIFKRLILEVLVGIEIIFKKLLFKNYDYYILSSPSYVTVVLLALFLNMTSKKYFLDIRDIYPEVFIHLGILKENAFIANFLKVITRYIYKNSIGIISVTNGLDNIINTYNTDIPRTIVYNGFDEELFKPSDKNDVFTVIFHGNMSKMQNIDLLVEVSKLLPEDINIIAIGSGPQENKVKNCKRINYLGRMDYRDLVDYINSAHVGLSFRNEGIINTTALPVKVFEYIGANLNVISTPFSEVGTVFEKYDNLYEFRNSEAEEIVNKIVSLKNNTEIVINSQMKIFSRQNQSKKFADFIIRLVKMKC